MQFKELNRMKSYGIWTVSNLDGARLLVGRSVDAITDQTSDTTEQQGHATALRLGNLANAAPHAARDLEDQFLQSAP